MEVGFESVEQYREIEVRRHALRCPDRGEGRVGKIEGVDGDDRQIVGTEARGARAERLPAVGVEQEHQRKARRPIDPVEDAAETKFVYFNSKVCLRNLLSRTDTDLCRNLTPICAHVSSILTNEERDAVSPPPT